MRYMSSPRHPLHHAVAGAVCLVLGTFAATGVAAQPRTCVRAMIAEPFALPNGSRHPAGSLRICLERDYSPVSGLHTIVAGDESAGMFLSRREKAESSADLDAPRIAFVRDGTRTLALRGYTIPTGGRTEVFWIDSPRGRRTGPGQSLVARGPRPTVAPPADAVWLVASLVP